MLEPLKRARHAGKDYLDAHLALRSVKGSGPYDSLNEFTQLVHRLTPTGGHPPAPHLNLLVRGFGPEVRFAGIHTALKLAGEIANSLGISLRVVSLDFIPDRLLTEYGTDLAKITGLADASVHSLFTTDLRYDPDDFWLVTYWPTAHLLEVANRLGLVSAERVLYLVQDYEPHFMSWSTEAALAQSTYHAGFHLVVNSSPLRDYLKHEEGISVADTFTFAPALDYEALGKVASMRSPRQDGGVQVFFYARPSKPRNLYPIGATALRIFATMWRESPLSRSSQLTVVSAGESAPPLGMGSGIIERSLGKVTYPQYYELLAGSSVAVSLMMSPHPSHPPLEAAVSGALSVTNEFGRYRTGLHPRLRESKLDPDSLAVAILAAVTSAVENGDAPFEPIADGVLGTSFDAVSRSSAARLSAV